MHGFAERDDRLHRKRRRIEVGHDGPLHRGVVGKARCHGLKTLCIVARFEKRRDVDAFNAGPHFQKQFTVARSGILPCEPGAGQFEHHLFAVADHDRIEKIGHRLRVAGARAAGDDQGVAGIAIAGERRDPGKFEHGEDVGVVQLVQQAEADDVEPVERGLGLQREEGGPPLPQPVFQIRRRGEHPLGRDLGLPVEDVIQDLHAEVGGADFIEVGKRQGEAQLYPLWVFLHGVDFRAQIAARFFDQRQKFLNRVRAHRSIADAPSRVYSCSPETTQVSGFRVQEINFISKTG